MKIGLFGIFGVYNFGCEAIVLGAEKFLNIIYPDSEIIYYSFNYEYDKTALKDTKIQVRNVISRRTLLSRVKNKILGFLNKENRVLFFNYKEILNEIDLLVSIGGDIYTIPEYLRKDETYPYYNSLVDFCSRAIDLNKPVIVYGASVGPFGNYKKAINYYVENLRKYKLIICRENLSIEYLKQIGLENCVFFPDPAYLVKEKCVNIDTNKYIGINLSPLSIKELYGELTEENIKKLANLLDKLYERTNIDLLFLPHVLSNDQIDNDLSFLSSIKEKMNNFEHVMIADSSKGFLGIKKQLHNCILVASARMHCSVNAIVEGIPTIFLAYSQKSYGMCKYIYSSDKWVINIKNLETELIPTIESMLKEQQEIQKYLKIRNDEINKYCEENILKIKDLL